jgi:hypothetical protein
MGRHQVLMFQAAQVAPGQLAVMMGPQNLAGQGCNLQVEIATSSLFVNGANPANPVVRQAITVMAHLDTGAGSSMISPVLALHLALVQTGVAQHQTANGQVQLPTYAIDLLFAGTSLSARKDLPVAACTLPFTMAAHTANPLDVRNFGVLIGRDIMAAWHMTWDGPTSSVFISD